MAFLQAKNEDSISWFLQGFLSTVRVCPKVLYTDASPSILCAVEKVLLESFTLLDEWHINQRQQADLSSTVNFKSSAGSRGDMGRELHRLQGSKNVFSFRKQRLRFEGKWFGSTVKSLESIRREHPSHFALPYLHSAAAEDMYGEEDFLFNDDDHTEINTQSQNEGEGFEDTVRRKFPRLAGGFFEDNKAQADEKDIMLSQNEGKPTCSDTYAWRSFPRRDKLTFYLRKKVVVSCFNKRRAGRLFLALGTEIFESFNSLYMKTIVEKRVARP